jgi:dTDP-4-dehydrorhamnose 3,5-epimerase
MSYAVTPTHIPDELMLKYMAFGNSLWFFWGSFHQTDVNQVTELNVNFVQDIHNRSVKSVLRGLHNQFPTRAQGKLAGSAMFDVAVDIRKSASTLGQWMNVEFSEENRWRVRIPPGYAHVFVTLNETADLQYKTTDHHAPAAECSIFWDDPDIGIRWPVLDVAMHCSGEEQQGPCVGSAEILP